MKKWALSIAVTAGLIGLTACNSDKEAVVETKAGDITKEEFYNVMKDRYGETVLQELVYEKVLSEKYTVTDKEVKVKTDELKAQMGENFETALASSGYKSEADLKRALKIGMLQEKAAVADIKVKEADVKKAYEDYKPQIKARHILVEDEKTANEVKAKLDKGEDFAKLAKEYSTDTGTAEKGGELGWFGQGEMVPAFEEQAYKMKKDEISKPIKSDYGYHIIQLLDTKEKESYEDMKKDLEYDLKVAQIDQTKVQDILNSEVKKADVKIKDKDLKDAITSGDAANAEK
ncbi:peptidylprolyl isomerase [Peribacillus frigoritolerans]|uniref:peptidylprolyl isomerase n=1 Tax=Peribacillus frigoritolerans TaxID=450367 RepID=UPI00207A9A8E|nr:peptidylprolyl isomerase [Peribacillus frigoritolerans]MDM5305115.1 peptidylprolyl isomerase [Peribacillus frigoritolerans]USK81465.1 peptidylprolyl isomerase [Peribacillus frigoritolerans]WJE48745.1 peptidylprolyl isomerase [Peribacillus frigoritolerans]